MGGTDEREPAGERAATIEQLYNLYRLDVYRYALFVLGNTTDAEDATQEVFVRAYKSWGTFQKQANPKTWLWSILRNHIRDILRKRKTIRTHVDTNIDLTAIPVLSQGSLTEWEDLLQTLTLPQRQAVYLRLIENLSVADTAETLDWNKTKVRITLHRAIKALRSHLQSDWRVVGKERESRGPR